MSNIQATARLPRYEKLANELAHQMNLGIFRPGERIPSVREISRQRNLSITTVLQAYRLLEDRGFIIARPQSGYYVRFQLSKPAAEPEISSPPADPTQVSVDELTMRVLEDTLRPGIVRFGAAVADPALLPTARLNRILAGFARKGDPRQNILCVAEGTDELRIQVAQRTFSAGLHILPDELVITSGCTEAISLSLRAVCSHGDLVAIESPTYFGVLQALEALGLRALEIPTHPRTGISLGALRFAIENHPVKACVVISNFNNPLGSCMPDENKKELVEILANYDIPLIEDDIYGELHFTEQRPSLAKAYDQKGQVLLCSSFSKDLSPSYRVGWLAPGKFKQKVRQLKMATMLGSPILPQLAIAEFLASGSYDHHLRKIRRAYAQKVADMSQAVLEYFPEGTRVTNPSGGFVLWVQMDENIDSLELYKLALMSGITVAPGWIFSSTPKFRSFIRLNAAYWSAQTQPALKQLGEIAAELAHKHELFGN